MTGMYNRHYLEETLDRELLRASCRNHSVSMVLLDVDDFKEYNDTSGHAAGDGVLRSLGSLLRGNIRGEDIAARFGGDEFMLVLPESSLAVARERAEQICRRASNFHIPCEGKILKPVTLSIGMAAFPGDGPDRSSLLKVADIALYRAKRVGRGQVMVGNQNHRTEPSHRVARR